MLLVSRYMSVIYKFATDRPSLASLNTSWNSFWINFNNGQLTMDLVSKRQRQTVCISATKRGLRLDQKRFLDKSPIPAVKETNYMGVIFVKKVSFVTHLKYVKINDFIPRNIFKLLFCFCRYLVRSELDYGCITYGSVSKSYLLMLDPIHMQASSWNI